MKENGNIRQFKKNNNKGNKNGKKDKLFDDFTKKRAGHEFSKLMWVAIILLAVVLLGAGGFIVARVFFINKAYTTMTEISSTEFFISTGSKAERFGNNFIVYNSDGIKCVNYKGEQIWNEAFDMQKPLVDVTDGFVAVADYDHGSIYMMDEKSVIGQIETGMPIRKFKAAGSGYVMAVLDNSDNTPIYVYNTSGEEMLYFNTTMKGFGYPVEIAISDNGILGYDRFVKFTTFTNLGLVHYDGISYYRALANGYSASDNGVVNFSVYFGSFTDDALVNLTLFREVLRRLDF